MGENKQHGRVERDTQTESRRGWDRFLTDTDRDNLRRSGLLKSSDFGLGRCPALLLIDVYRAALGDRDTANDLDAWPMSCGTAGWEAVDRIVPLLEQARRSNIPVIHVTAAPQIPTKWGSGAQETGESDFGIVDEVAPVPGELVVEKAAPSAFQGTPLAFHLNHWRIDTLIICGEATSGCIRASVVDAATARFKVAVVEDCCFDRTEASHWMNLFDMNQKYADVMTSAEVAAYMRSVEETEVSA